jgi:hypothetical protein
MSFGDGVSGDPDFIRAIAEAELFSLPVDSVEVDAQDDEAVAVHAICRAVLSDYAEADSTLPIDLQASRLDMNAAIKLGVFESEDNDARLWIVGLLWEGRASASTIIDVRAGNFSLYRIADWLQDQLLDDQIFQPQCPIHESHPLNADIVDDRAIWVCPRDVDHPLSPIGQLKSNVD